MPFEPRNIVICLDGTGNQIEENLSNVLKLYRTLEKTDRQLVFYDQGVGTLKRVWLWGRTKQKIRKLMGMAFGYGLDQNVLAAYDFILRNYREEKENGDTVRDRIFIFGFSRGAHTARVLAALIYEIGILRPEQAHLAPAALTAYKQSDETRRETAEDEDAYEGEGMNFRRVANPIRGAVTFLGLFDTVSSVFVPNPRSYWPPLVREKPPHTALNPAVRRVRHAISLDERRRMFRVDPWPSGQAFKPNPHTPREIAPQDSQSVWFPGFHSDIGGGHRRRDSGISQIPLIWMLEEAGRHGLAVNSRMARYVSGVEPYSKTTHYLYPAPEPDAPIHDSMTGGWWLLEVLPRNLGLRDWPARAGLFGLYLPLGEPRPVPDSDSLHPSVHERMAMKPRYRPVNLPDTAG